MYLNSTTRPRLYSTDSGDVFNPTNIVSGEEVLENGVFFSRSPRARSGESFFDEDYSIFLMGPKVLTH